MPRTHSLHKGWMPTVQWLGPKQPPEETAQCCCYHHRGSRKNPSSMVILNACRVANELCWFKKKKGKHKSKDMDKAQESPGPHWVRPGGWWEMVQTGRSIQQMVYITEDWQFRVSSQFYCCSSPKRANQRKRGRRGTDGACRVRSSRLVLR